MENHYEINVSRNGLHFFATSSRSVTNSFDLDKVLPVIQEKFPESEGYSINVTHWQGIGTRIEI